MADTKPKVKIALEDLYVDYPGGIRAHSAGDEVPADTEADLQRIVAAGWADKVANPTTKAAVKASDPVKE